MIDTAIEIAREFWAVLAEMSPYLLFGFIVAGILSVVVSQRIVDRHLGRGFSAVVKAAVLGIPLPLCSCGVIPVSASIRRHGASRGATLSFLLSTPQTGVDSILVTYSLLGPVFAIFRPIAALATGLIGGVLVRIFGEKDEVPSELPVLEQEGVTMPSGTRTKKNRIVRAAEYGFISLPQDIGRSLIIGLIIAGLITAVVPDDFFMGLVGAGVLSMVVMMAVGVPIYVCATASVPVAAALMMKGFSPGAALVFLIAGPATNAAAVATIWKVLGKRTTFIYLFTVAFAALASGLLLNEIFQMTGEHMTHEHTGILPEWIGDVSAVLLLLILFNALISPYLRKSEFEVESMADTKVFTVEGMTCNHCAANVEKAIREIQGVSDVKVDLTGKRAAVSGEDLDPEKVKNAVETAGYKVVT